MSTLRLPPTPRSSLAPSHHAPYDRLATLASTLFGPPSQSPFLYQRPSDAAFIGPFPFFLAAPEAGEHTVALFGKLAQIPGLPAMAKEVAILTVGAHYKAGYELYAHMNVARKVVGMDREVVEGIARGEKPEGLSEEEDVALDVAKFLVATPGPLPGELWDRGVRVLGKVGMVALVHYVGAYAYTCIVLNAMDCPVPEEGEGEVE